MNVPYGESTDAYADFILQTAPGDAGGSTCRITEVTLLTRTLLGVTRLK